MEQDKEFTKVDEILLEKLKELNIDSETAIAVFLCCETQKSRKKFIQFLADNENSISKERIVAIASCLHSDREQYFPLEMWVEYVGRTNQELTKNKIYHVDLSYDCDEAFLLVNDSGKQKKYNAKSFIVQIPTFVKITDITNPFIKENLNDLELNKTYKVLRMQGSYYVLENNCLCMPYRTEALGFRKMPKTKHPKKTIKELLEWLCEFMEFNRSSEIKDYISNDCVYQSSWGINELSEKACVVAFIRFVHNECMRNGVFYEFKVEEFSKQEVNNLENLDGEPCVKIYYRKQLQAVLFLTLNCRGCISKISIYKNDTLDKSYSVEATQNVDSVICY